jgi:hypothetical protein
LSADLIREPGDDVGVINECHNVTNTTQPSRQGQGGKNTRGSYSIVVATSNGMGKKLRKVPNSTLAVTR